MTERSKRGESIMGCDDRSRSLDAGKVGEKSDRKISVSDHESSNSDSFVVDVDRLSHIVEKDSNSRITRKISRKGSVRDGDMKISGNNERDSVLRASPKAAPRTPEKPGIVAVGPTDHSAQCPITIPGGCSAAAEMKPACRRFSFRQTHSARIGDPRRILIFFATISSVGTILLIYFTLSMAKLNGEVNASI